MNTYTYEATDRSGRNVKGKMNAATPQELYDRLREEGLFCSEYKQVQANEKTRAKYKYKTKELSLFCRQLASMLASGINVVKAIHILMTQEEKPKPKAVLQEIYEEVQRGSSFSDALQSIEGAFPELFVNMVASGEASGNLDLMMARVSDHYAKENRLQNTIKKGMTYPIILVILMIGVVFVLFGFVMPTFVDMFSNPDDIPDITAFVMGISDFFVEFWWLLLGLMVGSVFGIKFGLTIPAFRYQFDKAKIKIKGVGKLIVQIYLARFSRTMANLYASGLQMVDCLEKSVATLNNAYISKNFETVIENVKRGENVSDSIAATGIFDAIFTSTLYIGEESGRLDEVLESSADFYDEESETAVTKLVTMIEPVMIIFMGGMVMLVLAAVFPAMYGSFEGMA
ncbi:MAG: type II secretion system F family protein [Oscillospiraceae bacterium]|nr:type II secretion system F family protein [Oscillospiraceae bacterium]